METETPSGPQKYIPRGGYILFYTVLGIMVGKDIIDIICVLLDALAAGLAALVLTAPLGAALLLMSEVINKLLGVAVNFTGLIYFAYIGGKFGLRFAMTSIAAIIDAVPIVNVLPLASIMFVFAFMIGKAQAGGVGKIVSYAAKITPVGRVATIGKAIISRA